MNVTLDYREPTATRNDWAISILLAVLVLGFLGLSSTLLTMTVPQNGIAWWLCAAFRLLMVPAALLWSAAVLMVRHRPVVGLALATVGGLVTVVATNGPTPLALVVPFIAYSVARWTPGRASRRVLWVGALGTALAILRWVWLEQLLDSPYHRGGLIYRVPELVMYSFVLGVVCSAAVVLPYLVGRRFRDVAERRRLDQQREIEAMALHLQTEQQRVLTQEAKQRNAIARELHDIIAHSLSVMIVQAEGAKAVAEKNPGTALVALDTIAETGRDALSEARRMVSVLRRDVHAPGVEYAPTPTLADIPDLVARSGDRFHYSAEGTMPTVSATVGLAAYRITQEAITNVVKHAGPDAQADVRLTWSPQEVIVEVIDDGLGSKAETDGCGNGITGMHERAASVGGHVIAQPAQGGGFHVKATLPVTLNA